MSKAKLDNFLFDIESNKNIGNTDNEKTYSVVILLSGYPYAFYDKTQDSYEGFAVDIAQKIFKDLKLKTKITWVKGNDVDFNQTVKDVADGKYDIGIGNFGMTADRAKLIKYTYPIYLTDDSLVFRADETNYYSLFRSVLKIWLKPFIFIFISAILIGLISYFLKGRYSKKKHKIRWHLWGTLAALLGEPGTIVDSSDVNNKSSIFLGILILALTFYIGTYLTAITTSAALKYTKDYDPFDPKNTDGIKNKRILVNKGTNYVNEVKRFGGTPILKERKEDGIELLIKNDNIDGYYNDTGYIMHEKEKRPDFKIDYSKWSQVEAGIGSVAFILNKDQTTLLRRINRDILKKHNKGFMRAQCTRWMDARPNKQLCRL